VREVILGPHFTAEQAETQSDRDALGLNSRFHLHRGKALQGTGSLSEWMREARRGWTLGEGNWGSKEDARRWAPWGGSLGLWEAGELLLASGSHDQIT
jgi:hypothetical protein